jgi:hypothetical protein
MNDAKVKSKKEQDRASMIWGEQGTSQTWVKTKAVMLKELRDLLRMRMQMTKCCGRRARRKVGVLRRATME